MNYQISFNPNNEDNMTLLPTNRSPKLLDRLHMELRTRECAVDTQRRYCQWVAKFFRFYMKHPKELDESDVRRFLAHFERVEGAGAGTRNQALVAIIFLYRRVLKMKVNGWHQRLRAKPNETVKKNSLPLFSRPLFPTYISRGLHRAHQDFFLPLRSLSRNAGLRSSSGELLRVRAS